jgi:hypothetical protein
MFWIVGSVGLLLLALAGGAGGAGPVRLPMAVAGLVLLVLGAMFSHLTIRDEGDALALRFGPLALVSKRIPYARIRAFRPARSALIDGWGIHWVPGRGWTWNLWGRDCVELELDGGRLRVGTDDPEGLAAHLASRAAAVRDPGAR